MKIAFFVHCFFPEHFYGTETYTLELARNLRLIGHEVTVVSGVFQGEPAKCEAVTTYEYDGIPVVAFDKNHVQHARISETYYQEATRPYIRSILERLRPDLVHVTHLLNHTAVLLEEAGALGIPVVATLTDFFGFCFNNRLEAADGGLCSGPNRLRTNCVSCFIKASGHKRLAQWGEIPGGWKLAGLAARVAHTFGRDPIGDNRAAIGDLIARPGVLSKAYEAYDALIAPSSFLREAYLGNGFPLEKLHLSYFGVDIDRRAKPARGENDPIVLGYIGQIASHKGVDLLLNAVKGIPRERLQVLVYGPEEQDTAYMQRLRSIAAENVRFCGTFPPEQMAAVLAQFDLLVIPSRWYENSPLVLLNALASHTPVIVSNVLGLTEFIEPGVSGWSFERGSEEGLRKLVASLLEDSEKIRAASRTTSYDRTSAMMANDVHTLYKRLC